MLEQMEEAWGWTRNDHICNVLPLHHVHGIINVLNTSLWSGAKCTLLPKFDAGDVWSRLLNDNMEIRPSVFMGVPTVYSKLIDHYDGEEFSGDKDKVKLRMKRLRLMVSGSAALTEQQFLRWEEITGHRLLERFGMTEIGMALTNSYLDGKERVPGHVGHPFSGVSAKLLDLASQKIHDEAGEQGELLIRSNCMFDRYLGNEEATAESFFLDEETGKRWFKTGDLAEKSKDNGLSFRILGRLSQDIIKKQGYKVSAIEIEHALLKNEAIKECSVVGTPHDQFGEEVVAFVVLKHEQSADKLEAHARELLSKYKVPRVWKLVDELPKNQMGKVVKAKLKEMALE
uniref:Uncharacterized protein n=1 Tax=Strombidium rassoulzadegani TaxID=1082188 RepID=A0A7S3CNR7_9SPIT|mmetsp:Transcript_18447/g.31563  ORF Transcript_18447/g.31563 Transcript_18447/m.31563 type:complete len:343 (+) Transcript_18447:540-1568(+)